MSPPVPTKPPRTVVWCAADTDPKDELKGQATGERGGRSSSSDEVAERATDRLLRRQRRREKCPSLHFISSFCRVYFSEQYSVLRILLLGCSFCLAKNGDIYIGKHSAEEGAVSPLCVAPASSRAVIAHPCRSQAARRRRVERRESTFPNLSQVEEGREESGQPISLRPASDRGPGPHQAQGPGPRPALVLRRKLCKKAG